MKKVILTFIAVLLNMNIVNASEACDKNIIKLHEEELNNFTYIIENTNHLDMNGDEESGFVKLVLNNLSSNIEVNVITENGILSSKATNTFDLKGGVYELLFYVAECTTPIKKYEIRVPFYKLYCDLDKECKDAWFDGTYESLNIKEDNDNTIEINKKLIIVLVSLILISIMIVIIIKHQRKGVVK